MASIPEVNADWNRKRPLSSHGSNALQRLLGSHRGAGVKRIELSAYPRPTWTVFIVSLVAVAAGAWLAMRERAPRTQINPVVAGHLSAAQQALIDRHYIEPAEASAVHYYQLVLTLEPENREARAGIDRIADRVLADAEALIPRDKLADAAVAIEAIRRVRPAHPQLPRVEALLRAQQERLVSLAQQEMQSVAHVPAPSATTAKSPSASAPTLARARMVAGAEQAIADDKFDVAARMIDAARELGLSTREVKTLQARLQSAQQSDRKEQLVQLVLARTQANHLMEPPRDSATDYLQQLARVDRRSPTYQRALDALGTRLVANARTAIYQENYEHAARLLTHARSIGFNSAELESADGAVRAALQNPKQPLTAAQLRRRIRHVEPEYPAEARRIHASGWVDVTLWIAPNGSIANARVTQASLPQLFDRAALAAVRKWRYEPRPSSGRKDLDVLEVRLEFHE